MLVGKREHGGDMASGYRHAIVAIAAPQYACEWHAVVARLPHDEAVAFFQPGIAALSAAD